MTLQNGMIAGQRAYLWSDTAWLHWGGPDHGKVCAHGVKTFHSVGWPWAVSTSLIGGPMGATERMAHQIGTNDPTCLGDLLHQCETALRRFCAAGPGRTGRLLIAGWCTEEDAPRLFLIASDSLGNRPAFTHLEMNLSANFCNYADEFTTLKTQPKTAVMERLIARQRRTKIEPADPAYAPVFGVGGEIIRHTIGRQGVVIHSIKRWPDPIGRTINA